MDDSVEITAAAVGTEVLGEHPELHHYTDAGGLEGVVRSNTLWATHYDDLNDSTEIIHLRSFLHAELTARFRQIIKRLRVRSKVNRAVISAGGLAVAASDLASDLISSLYQSAFVNSASDVELSKTAASPFICSLCSHALEPYESKNGLLSQWRGYGRDGGYCLVFDTARLAAMLNQERDLTAYTHLNLHSARYAFEGVSLFEFYPALIETCERFLETAIAGDAELGMGIQEFFIAATTLKHRAFHEEREVRIVAIPTTPTFREIIEAEHPGVVLGKPKAVRVLNRPMGSRRYIALLEDFEAALPIKRIIVGPSSDQAARIDWAQNLCGDAIPVVGSETPYKG